MRIAEAVAAIEADDHRRLTDDLAIEVDVRAGRIRGDGNFVGAAGHDRRAAR